LARTLALEGASIGYTNPTFFNSKKMLRSSYFLAGVSFPVYMHITNFNVISNVSKINIFFGYFAFALGNSKHRKEIES
jgi:hypothetical protein